MSKRKNMFIVMSNNARKAADAVCQDMPDEEYVPFKVYQAIFQLEMHKQFQHYKIDSPFTSAEVIEWLSVVNAYYQSMHTL